MNSVLTSSTLHITTRAPHASPLILVPIQAACSHVQGALPRCGVVMYVPAAIRARMAHVRCDMGGLPRTEAQRYH